MANKEEMQRQFGCMNGIFQLFDRRYLLGQHRHGRSHKRGTPGQGHNGKKEFKIVSENAKDKNANYVTIEKHRASVESSRNSFSSSCSSTTFSSLDCSKRVQTELCQTHVSKPTSPNLQKKQTNLSLQGLDMWDVVKDSMTRETRVVSVRKYEQAGPGSAMKHVDSPRPVQYDRKDKNLGTKDKEVSRFSCDGRELRCSVKSTLKVKAAPRLSLDSKQNNVVARLMGLEGLTDSIDREAPVRPKNGGTSVYGEMERRLSELEFKRSGKDLRALKQILEAMQTKKRGLEKNEQFPVYRKSDQPVFPAIKVTGVTVKPPKMTIDGTKQSKLQPQRNKKCLTGEKSGLSPRWQRTKNGGDKKPVSGSLSDSGRVKKRPDIRPVLSDLKTRNPKTKPVNPPQNEQSCKYNTKTNVSQNEPEVTRPDNHKSHFAERLIQDKPMVELAKLTVEQQSPVSVLDAFYTEDTPSPVKNKSNAFNDYENPHSDEKEWKLENGSNELFNSPDDEATELILYPCENKTGDHIHIYIREILLASGFLKDLDHATRMVQLHPTGTLINPNLFYTLENTKEYTKYEKPRRRWVFDAVNEILLCKLKREVRYLSQEKLVKEICSEIDNLETGKDKGLYDEDDEVKFVNIDVNKKSEDWGKCCYEVTGLVLDIERLIFKDLISEFVNVDVSSVERRSGRHCRQLFHV